MVKRRPRMITDGQVPMQRLEQSQSSPLPSSPPPSLSSSCNLSANKMKVIISSSSPSSLFFTNNNCTKFTHFHHHKITSTTTKLFLVLLLSSCSSMSYTLSTTATAASPFATTATSTTTNRFQSTASTSPLFKSFNVQSKNYHHNRRRHHETKLHIINNPEYYEYPQGGGTSSTIHPLCLLRHPNHAQRNTSSSTNTVNNYYHHHNHYNNAMLNRILSVRKSIQQQCWRRNTKRRAATLLGISFQQQQQRQQPLQKHRKQQRHVLAPGQRTNGEGRASFYYRNDDDYHHDTSTSALSPLLSTITSNASNTSTSISSSPSSATVSSFLPSSLKRSLSTSRRTSSSSYHFSNEFIENHDFDMDDIELHPKSERENNKKRDLFYLSLRSSYSSVPSSSSPSLPRSKRSKSSNNRDILNVSRGGGRGGEGEGSQSDKFEGQRHDERIYITRPVPPLTSTILGCKSQDSNHLDFDNSKMTTTATATTTNSITTDNDNTFHDEKNNNKVIRPLCNSDISSSRKETKKPKRKMNQRPKLQILRYSQHRQRTEKNNLGSVVGNDYEGDVVDGERLSFFTPSFGSNNNNNDDDDINKNNRNKNKNKQHRNNSSSNKSKYRHHKLLTKEEQTQAKIEWAAKYTSLHTLRQTFGHNRNKLWGDFDSKTTRRLYHTLLPRALLGLYDIGLWSPKELAPLAYEARLAAKKYARERSVVPSRIIAMVYDGFRMWRDWGTWSMEGMSWEQVWDKYETQILEEMIEDCRYDFNSGTSMDMQADIDDSDECCIIDLNEQSVQEEITAQICLRILERSCATNGMIDKLFLEGKNENTLKRDDDLDGESGKSGISKFKRDRRRRLRRKNAERDLTRIRNRLDRDMQELLGIKPSSK